MRLVAPFAVATVVLAAACSEPAAEAPAETTSAEAAPAEATTTDAATPAMDAPALEAYVGMYPFDAVDGVVFTDHPVVRAAFEASGAPAAAYDLARSDNSTAVPIFRTETALVASGFDRRTGGSVNWNLAITPDGRHAVVCYQEDEIGRMYEGGLPTHPVQPRCAADAETAEDQLFEWPSSQ